MEVVMSEQLWWGTYPEAGLGTPTGTGEGLWKQSPDDARLVLALDAPSWLVAHPSLPLVYAVSEADESAIHAIDVSDPEAPRIAATIPTGGASACHALLAGGALTLYVAHYVSSELVVIRLGEDGLFLDNSPAQSFAHAGTGPYEARQDASHAHFVAYAPGRHHLLVCDLGTDELRRYAIRPDGLLDDHGIGATLPPGTGPRHLAVRGELIYVLGEPVHLGAHAAVGPRRRRGGPHRGDPRDHCGGAQRRRARLLRHPPRRARGP
ncbi:lactonase family protein [Demequina litorisediminis]|nr:beta-propeller fold lactonase family protein [Demequina litorisediminis]